MQAREDRTILNVSARINNHRHFDLTRNDTTEAQKPETVLASIRKTICSNKVRTSERAHFIKTALGTDSTQI